MTTAQPGQEQRMVTISHQMYLFLMGEGSLDGTWFGDNPCPTVAKGAFWWRSALRRYATRPTADLGDDGELVERVAKAIREEQVRQLRDDDRAKCPSASYYEEHVAPYGLARAALAAADRLILYREALTGARLELERIGTLSDAEHPQRAARKTAAKIDAALAPYPERRSE